MEIDTNWPLGPNASAMDPFGSPPPTAPHTSTRSRRASVWPALLALCTVAVSVLLLLLTDGLAVWVTGYLLAAMLAPALVVLYRVRDRRAQDDVYYTRRQGPRRMAALAIASGLIVGVTHAWMIATEIAKQ